MIGDKKCSIPTLHVDGQDITNDVEKASLFNDFFLQHSTLNEPDILPDVNAPPNNRLTSVVVTDKDISDLVKCLNINKASGPDLISHAMLKMAGDFIVPSLTRLFNESLRLKQFPSAWKRANVVPIFKKVNPAIRDNYRPVSLLSCVGKLFERIIFKYVFNFLRDNDAISIRQSGFKPGDSTVCQLTYLYHTFVKALEMQKDIRIVFCDISKAFDRVWHSGLLAKLESVGICDDLLTWFKSYLTQRKQRVVVNGQTSSWGNINAGVPQGSVLGPLLFLVYINDITTVVQSAEVRLFADDTILYLYVDNPVTSAQMLNDDLSHLHDWAQRWLVKFSPTKTKTMTVSRKKKKTKHPDLRMSDITLEEVDKFKHLGVQLTPSLSWNEHIDSIVTKANQTLNILNALRHKLDRGSLETLYFAYVRSKLEYACVTWDNCSKQCKDLVESVQYRAAQIVSGGINRTSHKIIYQELGWETLDERRRKLRLKLFFKMITGISPSYLSDLLPRTVEHNLRNQGDFYLPQARTSTLHDSFIHKTARDWNELDNDTKSAGTLAAFSNKLNKDQVRAPRWYYVGERHHSALHARLRMLCSPLNDHLFSHIHVIDDPACACGHARENNRHFFLECPLYTNQRDVLMDSLHRIDFDTKLTDLLYGSSEYNCSKNTEAFKLIQVYIKDTGRFD